MSVVAKRALLAALTVIGLVLLLVGAWFTVHLGSSGSAVLRSVGVTPGLYDGSTEPSAVDGRPAMKSPTSWPGAR